MSGLYHTRAPQRSAACPAAPAAAPAPIYWPFAPLTEAQRRSRDAMERKARLQLLLKWPAGLQHAMAWDHTRGADDGEYAQ